MLHLLNSAALKEPGCIWSEAFCFYLFHYAKGRKVLIPQRTVAVQVQVAAFSLPHICSSARPFKAVVALQCWKQSRAGCCRWKQLQLSDVSQTCRCLRIEVQHKRFSCPKLSLLQKHDVLESPHRGIRCGVYDEDFWTRYGVCKIPYKEWISYRSIPFLPDPTGSMCFSMAVRWQRASLRRGVKLRRPRCSWRGRLTRLALSLRVLRSSITLLLQFYSSACCGKRCHIIITSSNNRLSVGAQ